MSRIDRVDELLAEARSMPASDRDAFLEGVCGEPTREFVTRLLRSEGRVGDFLELPAVEHLGELSDERRPLEPGERLGRYEIVRLLGVGGTGFVYEAMQDRPRRRVALKEMRRGLDSETATRRFENEAEIIARLRHPNIAHVYETGVHEGVPFLAMEYIEGACPVVEHAADLGTRERIELGVAICDAVHHGHQKGIVHRDVKPGNVLVDEAGHVRIIDFGIARVEGRSPVGGEVTGTLSYMSPEQCAADEGDVDARTDVYSLGVLLYELLTGRLPYDVEHQPLTAAVRTIREDPPARVERALRGDVEAILHKALEKDPADRYASAAALADDLRRHLREEPVEARGGGLSYQAYKLARRHRTGFLALAMVVLVSLAAAFISGWYALENARARREAEFQAYVANIAAAASALRVNDVAHARRLLDDAPEGLRNWEWRHLDGRVDTSTRSLRFSESPIITGALSADGTLLAASGKVDGHESVKVWRAASDEPLYVFRVAGGRADALALDAGGKYLAVGNSTGAVTLHHASDGARVLDLAGHPDAVTAVAFSPGGERLATASRDRTARLWSVPDGRLLATLVGHEDRVIDVAFDPTGRRVATGGRQGEVRLWDAESGLCLATVDAHVGSVEGVAWHPDGLQVASVSRDRRLRVWDVGSLEMVADVERHTANVRDVAWSPDGCTIATASYDRTVRLWDARDGTELACLRGHTRLVKAVSFFPDGRHIATFAADGRVKSWAVRGRNEVLTLAGHAGAVQALAFAPDSTRLLSVGDEGAVRVWDCDSGAAQRVLGETRGIVHDLHVTAGSGRVFHFTPGMLRVWSLADVDAEPVSLHMGWPAAPSTDGRRVVSHWGANVIRVFDVATGDALRSASVPGGSIKILVVHGDLVATGTVDGSVDLWREDTLEHLAAAEPHPAAACAIAFHPAGDLLAVGRRDGRLSLLDAERLSVLAELHGHTGPVLGCAFSPDGTRLATAGGDETVRLWDVATGREVVVLHGHCHPVRCVAFSPDGTRLASGEGSTEVPGVIRVWEALPER